MGRKLVWSGSVIFILFVLVIPVLPFSTVAVGTPVVELKFDEGEEVQYADVAPGDSGLVCFPGTVSADLAAGGSVQDVRVNLMASTDQGWPANIEPAVIILNPGTEEAEFLATVSVPPETSWNISGVLTVSGTAAAFPGTLQYTVPPITGTIKINQYHRFSVGCDEPYQECCPESELCYEFNIYNEGNGPDKFNVEITNALYLTQESFTVNLETTTIEIPEKDIGQVNVLVGVPYFENINEVYEIELEVKSVKEELNTGSTIPQTFPLNVRVRADGGSSGGPGSQAAPTDEIDGSEEDEEGSDDGLELDLTMMLIIGLVIIIVVVFALWRVASATEE